MKRTNTNKSKKANSGKIVFKTVLTMLIVVFILAIFYLFQIQQYENGILDVYAGQQDTYVQLVLDQINLENNRNDEEIIQNILASLDASSDKYWTFSKDSTMLYVKDVLETNKYKDLTSDSYYDTVEARKFVYSLVLNKVTHATINLHDKKYIASGVKFEFNHNEYSLCLMTNRDILLDNNNYLGSKVLLITASGILLVAMFLATTISAKRYQDELLKNEAAKIDVDSLRKNVAELNEVLRDKKSRDTKNKLWSDSMLDDFLLRIKERNLYPFAAGIIYCKNEDVKRELLADASYTLDETVMRFSSDEYNVLFIGLGMDAKQLYSGLSPIMTYGCDYIKTIDVKDISEVDMAKIKERLGRESN